MFSRITVYEQRSDVGGIWNTDSRSSPEDVALFPSPIYHDMESNIPSEIMQYYRRPFPEGTPLLPDAGQVLAYSKEYADDVRPLLALRHQVLDVSPLSPESAKTRWKLKIRDLSHGVDLEESFDAVAVANGRYNKEYVPEIPGLEDWTKAYPDSVSHSKSYRSPDNFKAKVCASHQTPFCQARFWLICE